MNKLRSQYLYQLKGTIQSQQLRKIPSNPQPFYQLNILCENNPSITKIFVFKGKAHQVWSKLDQESCAGQRYLFFCQNYRGYYQVINWEPSSSNGEKDLSLKTCQYQALSCQGQATYQHILKLGSVSLEKQWVCSHCKKVLENSHDQKQ